MFPHFSSAAWCIFGSGSWACRRECMARRSMVLLVFSFCFYSRSHLTHSLEPMPLAPLAFRALVQRLALAAKRHLLLFGASWLSSGRWASCVSSLSHVSGRSQPPEFSSAERFPRRCSFWGRPSRGVPELERPYSRTAFRASSSFFRSRMADCVVTSLRPSCRETSLRLSFAFRIITSSWAAVYLVVVIICFLGSAYWASLITSLPYPLMVRVSMIFERFSSFFSRLVSH